MIYSVSFVSYGTNDLEIKKIANKTKLFIPSPPHVISPFSPPTTTPLSLTYILWFFLHLHPNLKYNN